MIRIRTPKFFEICSKSCLINCITTFKLTFGVSEYHKTIIELIYEICIKYFLNDENSEKSYSILLENLNFIFYDRQFLDNKKYSIFYVNDMIRYIMNKKKTKLAIDIKSKCQNLQYYNELFLNYEEFEGNFGDISNCKTREELPENAKIYLNRIEEIVKVPIKFIGTGAGRENMIVC